MPSELPAWVTPVVVVLVFPILVLAETRHPLRRTVEPKARRVARNVATGALGQVVTSLLGLAAVWPLAAFVQSHGWGVVGMLGLPPVAAVVVGFLLLDVTLWAWHWANHRVQLLWRFHLVHHADLDLDASTGLRFHFGELGLGMVYRALQVLAIGVGPFTLALWLLVLLVSVLFHHSNLRLPIAFERVLVRFVVTPRMHGIHHSTVRQETDSNFTSILTAWDRVFGTLRLDVPQDDVTIGVPAWRDPAELTVGRLQVLPLRRQRPSFVTLSGETPRRRASGSRPTELLA